MRVFEGEWLRREREGGGFLSAWASVTDRGQHWKRGAEHASVSSVICACSDGVGDTLHCTGHSGKSLATLRKLFIDIWSSKKKSKRHQFWTKATKSQEKTSYWNPERFLEWVSWCPGLSLSQSIGSSSQVSHQMRSFPSARVAMWLVLTFLSGLLFSSHQILMAPVLKAFSSNVKCASW